MSYVIDRTIQSYIDDERNRCYALAQALASEPEFLLFCIKAPCYPSEIDDQRKRFEESQPVDQFADLM